MKTLFVHQFLGAMGGAEADILLGAEGLRKRGHSPALLYLAGTGRNEQAWRDTFSQCFHLADGNPRVAREVLGQFQPDVVYVHNFANVKVLEALLDSTVPVVRRVHDHQMYCMRGGKFNYFTREVCKRPASWRCVFPCLGFVARNPGGSLPIKLLSYQNKVKEISVNRRCNRLVVYSEYQKEELVRNGFDPVKVEIHEPVHNTGSADSTSSFSDRNVILFVGQVIRGKGVDLLLRALAKVNVPFEAHILGDGNHRPYCQRLCGRLGLNHKVNFHGFVPGPQVKTYFGNASMLVVSSVWPEPFGLVGQEAMLHGLPVVGFDAGGIREWLLDGENGFLVPWKDTDPMAKRIEQLLRNKDLAKKLGARGQQLVVRQQEARRGKCQTEEMLLQVIREARSHGEALTCHQSQ